MKTQWEIDLLNSINEARDLTASQKKILDQFVKQSTRQQIVNAIVDTEDAKFLPQLERISNHETLITDIQRYLGDAVARM